MEQATKHFIPTQLNQCPFSFCRIDQRTGRDGFFNYDGTGSGVTVFVVDAGVLSTHTEFTGRFLSCTDYTGEGCSASSKHGTHVGRIVWFALY